jgi:hypothetical protein
MFFGRDAERTVLISNLRASRLTLLYAQSGTGKSSLLRAGVASRLRELARRSLEQRGSARHIPVVFSSWRDDPTVELIREIQETITPFATGGLQTEFPHERLEEAIEAANRLTGAKLLVMLDQFEDFLSRSKTIGSERFAEELAACISRPYLRVNFLISIRDDAYSGLGDLFKGRIANVYGNNLHLDHLSRESARQAIEKPITHFNYLHADEVPIEIEPELVETVLDQLGPDQFVAEQDVGRGSDYIETPYLQLVMRRLWDSELSQGHRGLRLQTLYDLGGASTIVRTHVDRALADLADSDREAAADILNHLVTPSGTKIALAASDLAEYTGRSIDETSDLLERLASSDTRILRTVPPPLGREGETRFEISHDLLGPAVVEWRRRQQAVRLEAEKEQLERAVPTRRKRWWR